MFYRLIPCRGRPNPYGPHRSQNSTPNEAANNSPAVEMQAAPIRAAGSRADLTV
jgi:hypothetical protein